MGTFSSKLGLFLPGDTDVVGVAPLNANQTLLDQNVVGNNSTSNPTPPGPFTGQFSYSQNGNSILAFDGTDEFYLKQDRNPAGLAVSGQFTGAATVVGGGSSAALSLGSVNLVYKANHNYLITASGFLKFVNVGGTESVPTEVFVNPIVSPIAYSGSIAYGRMNLTYKMNKARIPFRISGNWTAPSGTGTQPITLYFAADPTRFLGTETIGRDASTGSYTSIAVYDLGF